MRFAYSIYWGGTIVDAEQCDYESSRKLGLHCPFCNEALFLKIGHTRKMPDGSFQKVSPCFSHYPGFGIDCELRAKRPEGEAYIEKLEIESRNQRLILFNKHFIDTVRFRLNLKDENPKIKAIRKILGKQFTKPFADLFLKQEITLERIKNEASQNVKRLRTTTKYVQVPQDIKQELVETVKEVGSYINSKNMSIAQEIALWLQSKSATWSLDRLILFAFIFQCESFAIMNNENNSVNAIYKYAKKAHQFAIENQNLFLNLLFATFVSINWQNLGISNKK